MNKWVIIILLIIILLGGLIFLSQSAKDNQQIATNERQLIENWIKKNNLNEYGDPQDTGYAGGTPLFDERTGQRTDKYQYILKNHPDRPWGK